MKMGTKSLLYGAHQFIIHPATVFLASIKMRGKLPTWKECVCIFIHDWGYWGCENMEGEEGQKHPIFGAILAQEWLDIQPVFSVNGDGKKICLVRYGRKYGDLVMFHSRSHAALHGQEPSELCWWDKLCVIYDPWWLYLPRVILTGEINEYRAEATKAGLITPEMSHREWYEWARERMVRKAYAQDARPPYTEGS